MKNKLLSLLLVLALTVPTALMSVYAVPTEADFEPLEVSNFPDNDIREVYEAEEGTLGGTVIDTTADDFHGAGYVGGFLADASVTFDVTVPAAGNYAVRLRYINASGASANIALFMGDTKEQDIPLLQTINENTWGYKTANISLEAGENALTFKAESNTVIRLDRIQLYNIYEAEAATALGGMGTNNDHAGFTGAGFAAGFQGTGQGVSFNVNVRDAGEYSLVARYAAGHEDSHARSISVYVNGVRTQILLNTLRSWKEWGESQLTINLNAGSNEIKYVRDGDDNGEFNLDHITVKKTAWNFAGNVREFIGNNTEELIFDATNCLVKINSVAGNALKVWVEPSGKFERKYESFSTVDEAVDAKNLRVTDAGEYYAFDAGNMDVRVYKNPMRIVYLDKSGTVICENDMQSMGWSTDGELKVNNKLAEDEQFWGLGEKLTDFNRRDDVNIMWSHDAYGNEPDSSVPKWEEGRWYMANPYFVSSKGYSIFFDNSSRTVFDLGKSSQESYSFASLNPNPGGELIYFFVYGPELKQVTKTYTDIIGKSFFAPKYAYGNHQSHFGYNQNDIETVAQTYRDKNIPLDVIMADIEWYEYYCTPTKWHSSNFPNPTSMFSKLDALNIRMGVIDDPNITNRDSGGANPKNVDYNTANNNSFFVKNYTGQAKLVNWPWGDASGLMDFFDPAARDWWGEQHNMILEQGVDCFWLDMNEPARYNTDWLFYNEDGKSFGNLSEVKNAYAIQHHQAIYDKMTENGDRSFLLTRSGFTGSQRYVSPWTGDIMGSYKSMHEQINLGTSLSMTGYNYWGFDIGGFFDSVSNDQYKRWVELATFTPIHRFHYCNGVEAKEPWTHDSEELSKKYINLRYRLTPYFYSYSADSIVGTGLETGYGEGGTGLPMVRPMVMEYPQDTNTYNMDTQFMNGQSFLIAPVVDATYSKNVYLPKGNWYDYDNGKIVYEGGQNIEYDAPADLLPVFVKEGSIIPMQTERQYMDEAVSPDITLDIFPTIDEGEFDFILYEDDGKTEQYKDGKYATTKFEGKVERANNLDTLTFDLGARAGEFDSIAQRNYMLQVHNGNYTNINVTLGGQKLNKRASLEMLNNAASGYYTDKASGICYIKVADTKAAQQIVLTGESGTNVGLFYEAENGTLENCIEKTVNGIKGVGNFTANSKITFTNIDVAKNGYFPLSIRYSGGSENATLKINGVEVLLRSATLADAVTGVHLMAGSNIIVLECSDPNIFIDRVGLTETPRNFVGVGSSISEAEDGDITGGTIINNANRSGEKYVGGMANVGDNIVFKNLTVLSDGSYCVSLIYSGSSDVEVSVKAQSGPAQYVTLKGMRDGLWSEATVNVPLKSGENNLTVTKVSGGILMLDCITCPLTAYSIEPAKALVNAGFDLGNISGWNMEVLDNRPDRGYGVDQFDAFSGSHKFYFWEGDGSIKKHLKQTVTGLPNGDYIVKAKLKQYSNPAISAQLTFADYDDTKTSVTNIHNAEDWYTITSVPVTVKDGKLTIGFYFEAPSGTSLQIDDVELFSYTAGAAVLDKSALRTAINNALALNAADYTVNSWTYLAVSLAMAQNIYANANTAGDILGAIKLIEKSVSALVAQTRPTIRGDLDGNGTVNLADIVMMRNWIMEGTPDAERIAKADLDGNNQINLADIVALRNIIMGVSE